LDEKMKETMQNRDLNFGPKMAKKLTIWKFCLRAKQKRGN
jgi:hypothetical protein